MSKESKSIVLVADDEPSTVAMLSSHLRSKGFTVLEASDGDQAWELAHEHLPNLVLLDVMMPGMSGWEVCRKIREAVSLAHTGVIMLTGIGENLNEMTSPLYGADAHLDKPFEFSDLDRKISETIARRSAGALGRADAGDAGDAGLVKKALRAATARKPPRIAMETAENPPPTAASPRPARAPTKKPTIAKIASENGPKPALAKAVARPAPRTERAAAPQPALPAAKKSSAKNAVAAAEAKPQKSATHAGRAKPKKTKAKPAKPAPKAKAAGVGSKGKLGGPGKPKRGEAKPKVKSKAKPAPAKPGTKASKKKASAKAKTTPAKPKPKPKKAKPTPKKAVKKR